MRPPFKLRSVRILAILAAVVALYAAAGFLLVPRLLRTAIVDQSRERLGLQAKIGDVRFNPFLLQLRVADLTLADAGGAELVGFDRLFVDFDAASSAWHREYRFRAIDLGGPVVNAVVVPDGTLNLGALAPKSPAAQPAPPAPAPAALPRIRIASLQIAGARFSYEDREHAGDFSLRVAPIDFELRDFATDATGGAFAFAASTPHGERISWHGRVAVQPVASDGEIRITDLRARTVSTFLRDRLGPRIGFALNEGRIAVDARYRFALQPALQLRIDAASARVDGLGVAPAGSGADWIRLPKLAVDGASLDLAAHRAHVDRVALSGLDVDARLDADRRLNLLALAGTAAAPQAAPAARPNAAPWQADLGLLSIDGARLSVEDGGTQPAAKFVFAPLALQIDGASLDMSRPVAVRFSTGTDGGGHLDARGNVVPAPLAAKLELAARGIDLHGLQPYVAERTALTLERGRLGAALALRYHEGRPAIALTGSVRVDDLHTIDDALREDLVDWRRIDVRGLDLRVQPDSLRIARIVADRPYARVIIEPDRTLNVKRILTAPVAAAPASAPAPAPAARSAPPSRSAGAGEGEAASPVPADAPAGAGEAASSSTPSVRLARAERVPGRGAERAAGAGAGAGAAATGAKPMRITIGAVDVENGSANFSDLSITPNFSSGIERLSGRISGLDSAPDARAKVDLHGEVGPYAPVAIAGSVNLFGPALYTDLSMSFRNMDLTIFNPYSGKFAGYDITKGKLSTELHYLVDGRKLDATHHVTIDQLEFGARTGSKDAVSLPIKLAVALLKDRNGVIDLNVPVSGSLDDPKFRLGPLIWKVVVNILEKAVTAPFKLLGALFGAGPQIQFADFRPGDASLDAADLQHMQVVAKALDARPQLKVDVPIAPLAELDAPALAKARFDAEVAEQLLGRDAAQKGAARGRAGRGRSEPAGASAAAVPAFEKLDPKARLDVLAALYRAQFHARPNYPEVPAPPKSRADADAAKIAYLEAELQGRIRIGSADLKALAERRAVAIEKALLTGTGVDPARVFLVANDKVAAHQGAVRLQLSLK